METRAGSNWRRASQISSVMSGPCASPQSGRWTVAPGVSLGKRLSPPNVAPAGAEDADAITTRAEPIIGILHDALVGQDGAVANLVFLHFFDGLVGLGHGEALGLRFHPVTGRHIEHFANAGWTSDGASAHRTNARNKRKRLQRDRRWRDPDEAQGAGGPQRLDVNAPVLVGVDGAENEVECP